jgi:AraC-like DNA-binding protein
MQLFLSLSGIILSAILLYFNARNSKSTIYLGIFFLLAGLYSFSYYALLNSGSVTFAAVVLVNSGILSFLIGPCLYFFIRGVLKDDPFLKKHDLWHLLPVLFFLIMTSPYLLSPWTYKKEVAGKFIADLNSQNFFNTAFLGNNLLAYIVFILPALLVLAYVLWSSGLLFTFLKHKRERQVFISRLSTLRWIKAFLGIEIILVSGHLLLMVKIFVYGDLRGFSGLHHIQNILGIGPLAILLLTFFSPEVLYGLPRIPAKRGEMRIPEKEADKGIPLGRPTQKQLESDYLKSICRKADTCMEHFKPYTNPGFNLAQLSVLIHIPVHHLTYYFREEKKQSFIDYRNEWRVKHAKSLLKEGKSSEMTLEAIGLLSGFPNRDSFRTAFHRTEGVTPAVYISQKHT